MVILGGEVGSYLPLTVTAPPIRTLKGKLQAEKVKSGFF
jgi:hypothetical protein